MTNQQGAPEAPSYEHQRAIMEGERNASLDAYSRVVYLTQTESRIYEAAFTNGWNRHAALVEAQQPAPSAAAAEIEALRALSVTNIMLNIVPGLDGMGHEVYAKSVKDVEDKLSAMGQELEDWQLGIRLYQPSPTPQSPPPSGLACFCTPKEAVWTPRAFAR